MLSSQWVECNGKRSSQIELRSRLGGQEVWPAGHTLPQKILNFHPKFPYKSVNSLLCLILEFWKEKFWKVKSYTKDNYAIKVTQTCGCNYSISRKLRTSTSSKYWGFGSMNNLRHCPFALNVSPSSQWRVTVP
jgi:hypothetical protein